jgi:uncharacterized repeat protein (TIGR01451 family)
VQLQGAKGVPSSGSITSFDVTFTVAVTSALQLAVTHTGPFTQGQPGTYTILVSNAATGGPTSGTVTVTENLPPGLALVSMTGAGWNCAANSCTRGDVLAAGASYSSITAEVNVASDAGSPLVNSVTVSGGSSSAATTMDSTTVNPIPVLAIIKSHTGSFTQGQTGAAYTVVVSNGAAAGPTNGTVTVTETVPPGMTFRSMTGTGWNCAANTCSRGDVLPAGSVYPSISVTVDVAPNAVSPQVNQVSVSGGGSATATANDSTAIVPPGALRYIPITPCRVVDTRKPTGAFGGPSITGGTIRDFSIPGGACGIPVTAQAYSFNAAVVPAGPLGFLTLWAAGQTRPVASTLNSIDGRIKSNAAIVPAGTAGAVSVFASNTTDVILDINGYFIPASDPAGLAFFPVTPCRLVDTRKPPAPLAGPSLAGGASRTFPVSGTCNLPPAAQAYSLNITAVPPGPVGFVTAWPTGQIRPVTANLNVLTGTVTANAAIVPAGDGGSVDVFASNATNVVIDLNGYFAPMATGGLSLFGVTPCRVVDTRKLGAPVTSLEVAVSTPPCGIPSAAEAAVVNVTVVPPVPLGFLTLWPQGQIRPTVATLNALDAAITSNLAIVPLANGSFSVFPSNPTHIVIDILGYFGQ